MTLSGTSTTLEANYFPPIELSPQRHYSLGLVELLTFNSIPNIEEGCNKFHVEGAEITIPTGSYELKELAAYLKRQLGSNCQLSIVDNNVTLRCEILCSKAIDFTREGSVGRLFGFSPRILEAEEFHTSDLPVQILKVNSLRVECNITTGAYINGKPGHTIHEFFPVVPPGYKIVEVPTNVIYMPITVRAIRHLQLRIVDQNGRPVNFRGEVITVRLHIKVE